MKRDDDTETINLGDSKYLILQEQRRAFVDKFGREPGPSDPVFFDPSFDTPVPLTEDRLESLFHDAILNTTDAFSKNNN